MSACGRLARPATRALGIVLAFAPPAAHACAVCNAGGSPANRFAFFMSTLVLSLLPLGLFVGAAVWLRARIRERFADEFTERDAVAPASDSPAGTWSPPAGLETR